MAGRAIVVGTGPGEVATLGQAHEALGKLRPSRSASAQTWAQYHRQAAAVYAKVAEVDVGHHYEALNYWSKRQREFAEEIERTGVLPSAVVDFG